MQFSTALGTASLLPACLPNIGQKPLATDATGPFPGFCMRHCIFSSKTLEFENTIYTGGIKGGEELAGKAFRIGWYDLAQHGWYDLAQHGWYDLAQRYSHSLVLVRPRSAPIDCLKYLRL